jgi:Sap, sulfolipid-1-addressing protein
VLSAVGFALIAALEPLGIVAYIAIMVRGGRRNAWGFVVGWMLCAGVVALLTVFLAGGAQQHDSSSTISSAGLLQIVLGIAALALLVVRRARKSRRDPDAPEKPEIPESDKTLGPFGAAFIAAMVQGWPVVAAAVAAVLKATDSEVGRFLGIILVIVVASSTYLAAQILSGLRPERTAAWLESVRLWIETHRDRVIDVLLLGVGLWLVLHGVVVQLAK